MTAPVSAFNPQQQYQCPQCEFQPKYSAVSIEFGGAPTLNAPQPTMQPQAPVADGQKNWIA